MIFYLNEIFLHPVKRIDLLSLDNETGYEIHVHGYKFESKLVDNIQSFIFPDSEFTHNIFLEVCGDRVLKKEQLGKYMCFQRCSYASFHKNKDCELTN